MTNYINNYMKCKQSKVKIKGRDCQIEFKNHGTTRCCLKETDFKYKDIDKLKVK